MKNIRVFPIIIWGLCCVLFFSQQPVLSNDSAFTKICSWGKIGITDLNFLNEEIGFAYSPRTIYKTTDGGRNWNSLYTRPEGGFFQDLKFLDTLNGYVIYQNYYTPAVLLKTTDGGVNWDEVFPFPPGIKVTFTDNQTGFAVEKSGIVYKTTNGGKTWKSFSLNLASGFASTSFFLNSNCGWVGAFGLIVYNTTDGCKSWDKFYGNGYGQVFMSICFADSLNGLLSNGAGEPYLLQPSSLLHTNDGGKSWNYSSYKKTGNAVSRFFMPSSSIAYAVFINKETTESRRMMLLKTTDGGRNWRDLELSDSLTKNTSVYFVNEKKGYIFSDNGDLYMTTTGGEVPQKVNNNQILPNEFSLDQNYPNPFNPSTKIVYSLPKAGYIKLEIFTIDGRLVKTIAEGMQQAGSHSLTFSAENLNSGVFFYRLSYNGKSEVKKMLLIK